MTQFSKADLIDRLTESNDMASKAAATRTVEMLIEVIKEQVAEGNQVNLSGLCSFKPSMQSARSGIAPSTGKPFQTAAKRVVKIKPAQALKSAVL